MRKLELDRTEFIRKLGVRPETFKKWESGSSRPSPLAMRAIELLLEQKERVVYTFPGNPKAPAIIAGLDKLLGKRKAVE